MIPLEPDWRQIVIELYDHYDSYKRLTAALAKHGAYPDYSTLSHLKCGYAKTPTWRIGAALLNLYDDFARARVT